MSDTWARRPEVEAAYTRFVQAHYGVIDVPELCESMWNAGGAAAVRAMVEFQDIPDWLARTERRLSDVRRTLVALWTLCDECGDPVGGDEPVLHASCVRTRITRNGSRLPEEEPLPF